MAIFIGEEEGCVNEMYAARGRVGDGSEAAVRRIGGFDEVTEDRKRSSGS